MIRILLFFVLVSLSFSQCKEAKPESPAQTVNAEVPPLPESELRALVFNCTSIEYTFKYMPITLSVSQNEGLEANIFFASMESPEYPTKDCPSLARKTFNVGTEIYMEAEVYFSENCRHYDFYKNGKLAYRSKITDQGINFYANIVRQANKPAETNQ